MRVPSIGREMANNSVPLEFKAGNSRRCGWKGEALVWSAKELGLDSGQLLKEGALACLPFRRLIFLLTLMWRMVWRRGSIYRQRDIRMERRKHI